MDDEAAASALAFVVAGILFIAAVSAVLAYTSDKVPPRQANPGTQGYHAEAQSLLSVLIANNGTDTKGIQQRPSLVQLPGILNATQLSNFSAPAKDSVFNYFAAREALGLQDVHLGFFLQVNMTVNGNGGDLTSSYNVSYPSATFPKFAEGNNVDPAVTTLAIQGTGSSTDRYLVQLWVFPQS